MGNTITDGTAVSSTGYGSLSGVQAYFAPQVITFSTSSRPVTSSDIETELAGVTLAIDARLSSAGYVTPITDATDLLILDRCANLLTAASVLERMVIAKDPSPYRVETAERWRKDASAILEGLYDGSIQLVNTTRSTGEVVSMTPRISSQSSSFDQSNSEDFVEAYGSGFSGV